MKLSGRAKAAARDVDALKSLKVISRMDFSCGAYRFSILRRNIFFGNKLKINLKKKNLNKDVELQVQEVQEHNMLRAENQVMGGTVLLLNTCLMMVDSEEHIRGAYIIGMKYIEDKKM